MKRRLWILLVVAVFVLFALLFLRSFGGEAHKDTLEEIQLDVSVPSDAVPSSSLDSEASDVVSSSEDLNLSEEMEDVPEERGEDYSPIVEDYVVDLQDDETFEIG